MTSAYVFRLIGYCISTYPRDQEHERVFVNAVQLYDLQQMISILNPSLLTDFYSIKTAIGVL